MTRSDNIKLMKQNSTVVFMKRDIASLPKDGRPLSQANDLRELYKKRLPMYLSAADIVFEMDGSPEKNSRGIIGKLKKL